MPIYEYRCAECAHELEAIQKFSDDPLVECPNCHKMSLEKLISNTSFQLKGSGWYVTDIRDKGKPKKESGGESGGSDASSGASESKPTDTK